MAQDGSSGGVYNNVRGSVTKDIWELINDKGRLYSLDLETTGIKRSSNIWSFGFTNGKGADLEHFYKDAISPNLPDLTGDLEQDLFQAHRWDSGDDWAKKQLEAGSFKEFAKSGGEDTLSRSMGEVTDTLKQSPGVLLIQNANFENKRLLDAARRSVNNGVSIPSNVANEFYDKVLGRGSELSDTYNFANVSEDVIVGRRALRKSIEDYKNHFYVAGSDKEKLDAVFEASDSLNDIITKEIKANLKGGRTTIVDLMDITSMFQANLVKQGLLEGNLMGYGRGMELMALHLLGEKETHTALSDAQQQIRVFEKIQEANRQLAKGEPISDEVQSYIKALSKNTDNHYDLTFIKQVKNRIREWENNNQGKSLSSDKLKELVGSTLEYYAHAPETNVDRQELANNIYRAFNDADKATRGSAIANLLDEYEARIPQLGSNPLFVNTTDGGPGKASKAMSHHGKVALGLGAMAAIGVISMSSSRDKKPPPPTSYNHLYGDVELGTAYADWKERNNSHRSIYASIY